jgi:imidazolonepropionase-like amidohydrolase
MRSSGAIPIDLPLVCHCREQRSEQEWAGMYRDRVQDLREMHAAGVLVLAACDFGAPFVVPGFDLHDELVRLVDDVGLAPAEAWRAATLNPARFLGMADSLGSVEPGGLAVLVLLDANPLAACSREPRRLCGAESAGLD